MVERLAQQRYRQAIGSTTVNMVERLAQQRYRQAIGSTM
ncbi:unnamed protein product, partial [Rotaria magnacalcarata]